MASMIPVIEQIIMMFGIATVGFYLRQRQIMSDQVIKGVNFILLQVAWPCMIITATQKEFGADTVPNFLRILIVTIAILAGMCLILYWISRKHTIHSRSSAFSALSVLPNAGFVGLPIIKAIYGDQGVFYLSAVIVGFNLVVWTVCVFLYTSFSRKTLKAVINIGFIASIIGTALLLFHITLPNFILSFTTQLGNLTTPLAMLLLGARLRQVTKHLLIDKMIWFSSLIKLVCMPLLTLIVTHFLNLNNMLVGIAVLSMGMPSASVVQLFAEKYDGDVSFSVTGVSLSTLFCTITLPIILLMI